MKVKTYVFEDVKEGMELIKAEYGADTMILDIRNACHPSRKSCEISIAVEGDDELGTTDPGGNIRKRSEAIWGYALRLVHERMTVIESDLMKERTREYPLPLRILLDRLIKNGFDRHLATSIISEVYSDIGGTAEDSTKANLFVKKVIERQIKIWDIVGGDGPMVLLGPSGAGKTQTAKKLARKFSAQGKAVSILAYDAFNRRSHEDLMSFAEKNGVPFSFTTNEDDIGFMVEKDRTRKIVDLTGDYAVQKRMLDKLRSVEKIVVLPAGARDEKIRGYCDDHGQDQMAGIAFTKLDEEETLGHLGHNLIYSGRPLCVLTTGIHIEDILLPDYESLYKILLEGNTWKNEGRRTLQ
jgi:flagellar biosynthesis GTPase FlhF